MKVYIVYCLDCTWASVERTRSVAREQVKVGGTTDKPHKMRIYQTWVPAKWDK